MEIIDEWVNLIPQKKIINIELDDDLSKKYNNLINNDIIICFDIEFLNYIIKTKYIKTINELGGILFVKKNNKWYLYCIFHFNLKPLSKNINHYQLLTSQYNTTSNDTKKKIIKNEKLLLPEFKITEKNYKKILLNDVLINNYMSKTAINKLLNENNFEMILKKISKIKYMINGQNLKKLHNEFKLFETNINLILNDRDVKKRLIDNSKKFIKLTNILFNKSYLIIKGVEDLKAIENHSILLKLDKVTFTNIFNIDIYNQVLYNKCNSAQLEKTYICLDNFNLLKKYNKYVKIISDFTEFKAHNPLVDAYYTWIVFNIMNFDYPIEK